MCPNSLLPSSCMEYNMLRAYRLDSSECIWMLCTCVTSQLDSPPHGHRHHHYPGAAFGSKWVGITLHREPTATQPCGEKCSDTHGKCSKFSDWRRGAGSAWKSEPNGFAKWSMMRRKRREPRKRRAGVTARMAVGDGPGQALAGGQTLAESLPRPPQARWARKTIGGLALRRWNDKGLSMVWRSTGRL